MSDDTRRPGEDDEKPTDPPTGEGEVVGADWLLSQLGSDQTGEIELPATGKDAAAGDEPGSAPVPGKAGDGPVKAWWREKLVAADALVNPEPRSDVPDDDEPVLPEPGWTARSGQERSEPALFESARRRTPDPEPTPEPDAPAEPDAVTPGATGADEDRGWSLGAERELTEPPADEPETGLIPSADPPLFKPRSARDHIVEDVAPPVPAGATPPEGADIPAVVPAPVVPEPIPSAEQTPEPFVLPRVSSDDDDTDDENDDAEPFTWALTPNDELDPLVHRTSSGEERSADPGDSPAAAHDEPEQTAVIPTVTAATTASAAGAARAEPTAEFEQVDDAGLPPRRRRRTAQPAQAEPIVIDTVAEEPVKPVKAPRQRTGSGGGRPPRALVLGAIGLVAILVLVGLFFLGSRLPALLAGPAPTPTATKTPTPSATPTPTPTVVAPVGPAAAGEQKWTALTGGECIDPYSTPWAETFTVVDCAAPHAAQMVFSAPVNTDPAAGYPGEDAILKQIYLWCSAPGVLDAGAAAGYSDLQVQGTYPVSEEQWADGERNYFCFVNRSSGEPLTGSVAVPRG